MGTKVAKKNKNKSPSQSDKILDKAKMEFVRKDYGSAIRNTLAAIEADPKHYDSYIFAADVALEAKNYEMVLKFLAVAEQHFPNDLQILQKISNTLRNLGKFRKQLEYAKKVCELDKDSSEALVMLAFCYDKLQRQEEAQEVLEKAIDMDPKKEAAYDIVAALYDITQENEKLQALANKAKEVFGEDHPMILHARIAYDNKEYDKAIDILNRCLEVKKERPFFGDIYSLRANCKEKLGQFDEAFADHVIAQKELHKVNGDIKFEGFVDRIIEINHDLYGSLKRPDFPKFDLKDDYIDPVFIVGFPRSGTTLTEQAIFASGKFYVPDEVGAITNIHMCNQILKRDFDYPSDVKTLNSDEASIIRGTYFAFLQDETGREYDFSTRVADKMPINISNIGWIRTMFPKSKIIVILRDPRDVCLSCFFQTFRHNDVNQHFYTLEETVDYYTNVMELYLKYRQIYKDELFEFRYEDLVDDFENVTKAMYDYIDEEWTEDVMQFHKKKREAKNLTPNYNAIYQPLYKSSKQKWRNYEKHITPFIPKLAKYIKAFGYEV